jgi:hypothetical protein
MKTLKILIFFLLWHTTILQGQGDSNLPNTAQSFLKSFADAAPPPSSASSCDIFQRFVEESAQHPDVLNSPERVRAWNDLFSAPLLRLDAKWLDSVAGWTRVGLNLVNEGNGDYKILHNGVEIGLIKNGTLLSTDYIEGFSKSNPVGPVINGCQVFEDGGKFRVVRVSDTSPYYSLEKKWLQGSPRAHCLEKHGPDVSEEALIYRAVTGTAANGDTKSIVHSSKFYSSEEIKFALSKVNPETELFFEFVDPNNPGFVVVKAYLGKSLGYGYRKSSSAILSPTLERNINSIIAVWKQKPTGDWYLITMYPSIL